MTVIKEHIAEKSVLFNDGWKGYSNDDNYFAAHARVNHSKEFVNYKQVVKIEGPVPKHCYING